MEQDKTQLKLHAEAIRAVIAISVLWFLFVVATGLLQMRNGGDPSFLVTGQFGDSFGFIGSLMASTAAYFAYRTYQAQSEETRILRAERKEAAKLRAEPSFLNLLERRYDAINQVVYEPGSTAFEGQGGVDKIAEMVEYYHTSFGQPVLESYKNRIKDARNYQHLFRFIYHIVRYAERHFDNASDDNRTITRGDLSYQYVRLLRSQLSESELFLLALNVLTPEGDGAKRLYERYALFHNLSPKRQALVQSCGNWDDRAFGLPPEASK